MLTFEKEVRKALIDREMSMKGLSIKLGITQSYLGDICRGSRKGSNYKSQIIQFLNLDMSLVQGEDQT